MITKKIIGLDMGSCNIAAATPIFDTDGKITNMTNLKLNDHLDTIVRAEVTCQGEFFNYFKKAPQYFNDVIKVVGGVTIRRSDLLSQLFREILTNIIKYNNEIEESSHILLVVGCPSSPEWITEKWRVAYENLIREATGVDEVRVVPESRAAMFSALGSGKGEKLSAVDGAAVFDWGSYTADFTYMQSGLGMKELSWNLGASAIEKAMRGRMCQKARQMARDTEKQLSPYINFGKLERTLRAAKEAYFDGKLDKSTCKQLYTFETLDDESVDDEGIDVTFSVNQPNMDSILHNEAITIDFMSDSSTTKQLTGSWIHLCQDFLCQARDFLQEQDFPVKTIVLTGGASKMDFILPLTQEVFQKTGARILHSNIPEYSVSNGLVWVAVADEMEESCIQHITDAVLTCENPDGTLAGLESSLVNRIQEKTYPEVKAVVQEWYQQEENESLRDLEKRLQKRLNSPEFQKSLSDVQKTVISNWNQTLRGILEREVHKQATLALGNVVGERLILPASFWDLLCSGYLNLNLDFSSILWDLDVAGFFNKIIFEVVSNVLTVVATVVDHIIELFNDGIGLAKDAVEEFINNVIRDSNMDKPRKKSIRKNAWDEIQTARKEEQISAIIAKTVQQTFDQSIQVENFEARIRDAAKTAFEVVTLRRFATERQRKSFLEKAS